MNMSRAHLRHPPTTGSKGIRLRPIAFSCTAMISRRSRNRYPRGAGAG
jgi:hypothetical protein